MYISLQSDLDGLNTYINDVKSNILKIAKSSDMIHIGSESKRITSQIKFLERLLESLSWPYATSIDIKEKCSEISAEIQSAKNILEQAIPNGGLSHEAARLRDILMDKCAACEESLLNLESIANRNEEDTPTYLTIIATINGMRISIKQLNAKFHHFDMQLPKKIKPSTPQKVKSTHRGGFGIRGGDIYADDFPVPQANNEPINQADDEKLREALKKSLNMQQVPKNTAVEYRTAHDAAHVVVPQGPIDMSLYITEEKAADDLRIVELEKLEILKQSETASVVLADIDASSELDAGQSVAETGEDDYQEGEFEADDDTDDFDEEDFDDQEGSEEYSQQESAAIQSFLNDGVQNDDLSETGESNAVPVASSAFFTTAASSSFSVGAKNSPFESAYKPKLDVTEAQISKPVSAFSFGRVNNAASRSAKSADETSESQKMQASKVSTVKPLDISVLSVTGTSTEAMKVKAISNPIQIQPQPAIAKLSEVINEKPYVPEANALQTVFEKMLATPDIDLETPVHEMEADTPAVQTQIEVASLKTNDTIFSDNADSFFGSRVPKNAINPMFGAVKPAGNDHFDLESTNLPAISFGESIFGTSGQSVTPFGSSTQSSHANFANAPAFGAAAGMQPKPFGAASTTVFGQSTFAINATQSTPPKPFGATPFSQSAFQGTAAQSTPSSTFGGATGTFAKPLADVGEAAAQPSAFGQVSTFGGVSKFGQSGFGGSTSQTAAFDQAASSAGNAVAFGSSGDPSMRDFGNAPTASSFGQISAPAFGQSSMGGPAFGRSSMAQSSFGSSSFGQPSNSKHIIDPQALETSGFSAFAAPSSGFASFAQSSNSQQALPQAQFNTKSSFAPSSANSSSFSGFRE